MNTPFSKPVQPDWEEFIQCIARTKTPRRVHNIELFLDEEIKEAVCARFDLEDGLEKEDPFFYQKREIVLQRFLGYDYVLCGVENYDLPLNTLNTQDTAGLKRSQGRNYVNESRGPITTWDEYEAYPWPDPGKFSSNVLEWYQKNLPEDMCILGGLYGHFAENIVSLMGYKTLCMALYRQRDLVRAILERTLELDRQVVARLLEFERVRVIWGSDDMGFRSGPLISPKDLRSLVLPGHKALAELTHAAGRLYIMHSCGNLATIMDDLIDEVKIDGKHSYEDTILDVRSAKRLWGQRMAILGGIDLDFLCQSEPEAIRTRVHDTLEVCQPGGGYCLGTGNSVANYLPLEHYLAMLDEGRRYTGN